MKKIMIAAALSLSILAGSTVLFAQNDTATKATKKAKKSTATDTMSAPK